ncbi:DUF192 domain-containing protein [Limoniibacter endophyticus]|uniref:DUF192 domain-containing protein n=1 Tax=Limoniibacter endophyticus TaxID=1565040 RepID=A0A8J3DJN7_9HYPH|nr:DUF192 domain-containing protein [Limoniibacter endophyticus]GHC62015.1 hypothetical protein GCM10010136_02960 [Limoniibacter endophyticus]
MLCSMASGRVATFLALMFFMVGSALPAMAQMRGQTLPIDPVPLTIENPGKLPISLRIEIADTDERRATGLMFRAPLAADRGMLFVFDETRIVSFWMKETPSPLDLVFINEDGAVTGVKQGVPYSLSPIEVEQPSRFVLEIAGGMAERHGITAGTVLKHPVISRISKVEPRTGTSN